MTRPELELTTFGSEADALTTGPSLQYKSELFIPKYMQNAYMIHLRCSEIFSQKINQLSAGNAPLLTSSANVVKMVNSQGSWPLIKIFAMTSALLHRFSTPEDFAEQLQCDAS